MDPYRLLANRQLHSQSLIGVSGAAGVGFGYMRQPASPPMLTQQVKGTGEIPTSPLQAEWLGLPLWVWLLGAGAAYFAWMK
jgi:hypothetical protein